MATTRFIDIKIRSSKAERDVASLDKKMTGLGSTADNVEKSFGKLSAVATAVFSSLAINQVVKYADAFTSLQNQLRQTTKTTEELAKRTQDLLDISNRSRTEISSTTELYTQLTLATEELNLTTEEQLRLTETIAKSFAVSGKSAEESAGAIRQLGQAFSAGALRGDEFNSIAEGAPEIMRALQRETNKTAGELRAFAATGGITAELLVTALGNAADIIDDKMSKAVKTFAQSTQEASNNLTVFIGESATLQGVMSATGDAMVLASNSIESVAKISALAATVFAARMIPSITLYTTSIVANTASQLTATKATTGFSAAMGIQATAATRSSIAVNAMTIASRGLGAAMALIGGPVGAALIAATAIFLFVDSVESAEEKTQRLSGEVDTLTESFRGLNDVQRQIEISKLNTEMAALRQELIATNTQLNFVNDSPFFKGKSAIVSQLEGDVSSLNDQLDALSVKQQAIFAGGLPDITQTPEAESESAGAAGGESTFASQLIAETEQLKFHLGLRQAVENEFLVQAEADELERLNNKLIRQQETFDAEIVKIGEDEIAKEELRASLREAQRLAVQEHEAIMTDITAEEEAKRVELAEQGDARVVASKQASQNALLGLIATFAGKSKAAALVLLAIEKGLAISQTIAGSLAGSVKVFGELPYPAAVVASGQILAQGQITAGLIAATGLAQGASIASSSSAGGGVSVSAPIGGDASFTSGTPTSTAAQTPAQTNVVDLRTDGSAFSIAVAEGVRSVVDSLDTGISVSIAEGIDEARRIGALNE